MLYNLTFIFFQNVPAENNKVIYNFSLSGEIFSESYIDKKNGILKFY